MCEVSRIVKLVKGDSFTMRGFEDCLSKKEDTMTKGIIATYVTTRTCDRLLPFETYVTR